MRLNPVLSVLLPKIGFSLLGVRAMGRKFRTMREVSLLRTLRKTPRPRALPVKR